jgi:hypothetical protein
MRRTLAVIPVAFQSDQIPNHPARLATGAHRSQHHARRCRLGERAARSALIDQWRDAFCAGGYDTSSRNPSFNVFSSRSAKAGVSADG